MRHLCVFVGVFALVGMEASSGGPCPAQTPVSRGSGMVAGVTVPGGTQYYFKDSLIDGFDCFEQLSSWFPSYITSKNSISPNRMVIDMAYTEEGTATFLNVTAPATGMYTMAVRYAFASGLFPGVSDRPEGIKVNGVVITSNMHFPITGDFENFETSSIDIPLNAGVNKVQMFNIASASVSRVDSMTITAGANSSCAGVPSAPGGLRATATSSNEVSLTWSASTAPSGCSVGYQVFRSTTSGFTPSSSNQIASAQTATTYSDESALCNTTYYFLTEAADPAGESAASNQASTTTFACPVTTGLSINCGGPAVSPFIADTDFSGGGTIQHANTIDLSGTKAPAPAAAYQTGRTGNFSYTITGFNPQSSHTIRLHFAETYFSAAGARTFNVSINGATVLKNFDIFATAGAKNKAIIQDFSATASATGDFVIAFSSVVNNSLVSGIEIQ